jgi:hypothetical protein
MTVDKSFIWKIQRTKILLAKPGHNWPGINFGQYALQYLSVRGAGQSSSFPYSNGNHGILRCFLPCRGVASNETKHSGTQDVPTNVDQKST